MTDLHLIEIFCDGPGCETTTTHALWADSEREAFTKARLYLVREHGWARLVRVRDRQPVDLCPQCKPDKTRTTPTSKEHAHAR